MRGEPPAQLDPEWIEWDVDLPSLTTDGEDDEPEEDDPYEDDEWEPFLQPSRKRARTVTDPVEESEEEEEDEEEVEDTEEEAGSFPYPVDTKVARDFGEHGIFWGVIEKHYPDDPNLCLVRFTDGDREDLDREEVEYAVQLYEKEFGV